MFIGCNGHIWGIEEKRYKCMNMTSNETLSIYNSSVYDGRIEYKWPFVNRNLYEFDTSYKCY